MHPSTFAAELWAEQQFGQSQLGDNRRSRRLVQIATALADTTGVAIPADQILLLVNPKLDEVRDAFTKVIQRLKPNDTLIVEVHGSRVCRNDLFRTVTPGLSIPSGICRLRSFVPYDRP